MFFVYALYNNGRKVIYVGQTKNLESRLLRHNQLLPTRSKSYTSKQGGVWTLVHSEAFASRTEALRREKELKSAKGRGFIWKIIAQARP